MKKRKEIILFSYQNITALKEVVLGLLSIVTSVPLVSTPIPHLCASSPSISCAYIECVPFVP